MSKSVALAMLLTGAGLLWIGNGTDLDMGLAARMYDSGAATFPWRHAWLTEVFGHVVLKLVMLSAAVATLVYASADLLVPRPGWTMLYRLQVRVLALSAVLVPLLIGLLKQLSSSHCPWDLVEFGGVQEYVRLLGAAVPMAPPGHCMPAGHASSALWLPALAVFALPLRPWRAWALAGLFLLPGLGMGWLQQMRGAHFLTHTLWSAWIACVTIYLLIKVILRKYLNPN